MQIIFGDHAEKLRDRFTVLELDTFKIQGTDARIKAWCAVEKIPLEEMTMLDSLKKIHQDLIEQYRQQNWEFCTQAIGKLRGRFDGELDSFYDNLQERIERYSANPPGADWDADLIKSNHVQDSDQVA